MLSSEELSLAVQCWPSENLLVRKYLLINIYYQTYDQVFGHDSFWFYRLKKDGNGATTSLEKKILLKKKCSEGKYFSWLCGRLGWQDYNFLFCVYHFLIPSLNLTNMLVTYVFVLYVIGYFNLSNWIIQLEKKTLHA